MKHHRLALRATSLEEFITDNHVWNKSEAKRDKEIAAVMIDFYEEEEME